ncbi:hypothetical protein LTR56_000641 [Elasticomyces elasticus]|nr:hypothetical protein LTR56_000641 [Elasticomyces elasticus]KAK3664419.1 hypothetical protein LTR22_004832 [Elasticomyces elasticus]KAK4919421.1 hypothetical protein LTR49_012955 [Elasticomyces elasticus]KAK5758295.1 hypothetical protein LTS12_011618 [Elasticomyces elasticus]
MSIMDDSKTLISELIAVALTWTDETSQRDPQKDQQLVLKLHNVLQKERTTAATEALRLKALLAKTDNHDPADGELAEENARLKTELAEARQEQEAVRRLLSGSASKETSTASFERPSTAPKWSARTSSSNSTGRQISSRRPSAAGQEPQLSAKSVVVPTGPRIQVSPNTSAKTMNAMRSEGRIYTDDHRERKRNSLTASLRDDHRPPKRARAIVGRKTPVCGHCFKCKLNDTCDGTALCKNCLTLNKTCSYSPCHVAGCESLECTYLHMEEWDQKSDAHRKVAGVDYSRCPPYNA